MKNLLAVSNESMEQAAALIRDGGVVAFPTETVYGLGANAFNPLAAARIFEIKNRPQFDPLIVHIADFDFIQKVCADIPALAKTVMEKFWPGPLTLVLRKNPAVPDIVTSGLDTVGVRMPSHPIALRLIRESGVPIAAPSANPFGYLSPTSAAHVAEQLGSKVDLILDAGSCAIGIESTILDLSRESPFLLRPGGVPVEEIERVIGREVLAENRILSKPAAPGQLPQHYSPRTPLKILADHQLQSEKKKGLLAFQRAREPESFAAIEILAPSGDLQEAAVNLFSCLHRLDKAGLDVIYAEAVPESGLGKAIMDRLRRAACLSALI